MSEILASYFTAGFVFGFLAPFALLAVVAAFWWLVDLWRMKPPHRIAKWRAWRIRRLRRKANEIAQLEHDREVAADAV